MHRLPAGAIALILFILTSRHCDTALLCSVVPLLDPVARPLLLELAAGTRPSGIRARRDS